MLQFPAFLDLRGAPCVVVGAGDVAARKIERLQRCGARVRVIAPTVDSVAIRDWLAQGRVEHVAAAFEPGHLDGARLVIAATNAAEINAAVAAAATARNLFVNVVDAPELCTFVVPSIVERDPVQIAIGTGGTAPVLARLLRARLESFVPAAYGRLATLAGELRERVRAALPDTRARRQFWERMLAGPVAELIFAHREEAALGLLERQLHSAADAPPRGEVYLVGAGPGDPDLLTFRALRLMQQADAVVYDRLVDPSLVDLVRRDAERIFVGKRPENHPVPQSEINALLVELARAGKRVVRLKGGDPFIFGRGGEEIATLATQGIPFQVVPGITAAAGCATYAGIPLTHRDYAQAVVLVTGHGANAEVSIDWATLAAPRQTVCVYMGVRGLDRLCERLIEHGAPAERPAAVIAQGTTPNQRVVTATLATLPQAALEAGISAPSMVIIGEVVRLHAELGWYQAAP
jgi:uroporphyrin-III C-methyltransferase/precorrin-2 dehydrogenase/sirohydrochlorin ferrochelatase